MNKVTRKFISIFFSIVFFFASGTGQLIHATFHDQDFQYTNQPDGSSSAILPAHTYCIALQLMLPEFSRAGAPVLQCISVTAHRFYANVEPAVVHLVLFHNSDRAPPVPA
jgi:hypothetical protein